jgi:hypothetical protein
VYGEYILFRRFDPVTEKLGLSCAYVLRCVLSLESCAGSYELCGEREIL